MAFVKLSQMPSPPKLRVSSIQNLSGGLNLHDLAWQIRNDQSPEMKNMWWEDGVLQSRPGLTVYNNSFLRNRTDTTVYNFEGVPVYGYPYHGWFVALSPDPNIKRFELMAVSSRDYCRAELNRLTLDEVDPGGTFFLYNDVLYYKQKGAFIKLTVSETFDETAGAYVLQAEEVVPYIPTILMNADPAAKGVGDLYQPINRMSTYRRVLYNFDSSKGKEVFLPEDLGGSAGWDTVTVEYLDKSGNWVVSQRDVPGTDGTSWLSQPNTTNGYYLDFYNGGAATGVSNNLRVTYSVPLTAGSNEETVYRSLDECNVVEVYGAGQGLCVVMAGCDVQPNAYFWNGNTDVAMDPSYFPAEHYNLAGEASDPIVGFGKQQNMLVVFQRRQIGRCVFDTTEIDGRAYITLNYTTISPLMGCDFPRSIQLIENNLVFCNAKYGVMYIKDTSSAYENNIVPVSQNIERSRGVDGLLHDLGLFNIDGLRKLVTSVDDGKRYWLCVNDHVWLWDYSRGGSVNDAKTLSWFYFDNVDTPAGWLRLDDDIPAYVDRNGYLREFTTTMEDQYSSSGTWTARGTDFEKLLTLPIQDFGTYEVLKNVEKVIFVLKAPGESTTEIEYETDYESRADRQPIVTHGITAWVPRNLTAGRSLQMTRFAVTAIRKPRCLHVRHFLVRLKNSRRGEAISFASAQIYYTMQGVDR